MSHNHKQAAHAYRVIFRKKKYIGQVFGRVSIEAERRRLVRGHIVPIPLVYLAGAGLALGTIWWPGLPMATNLAVLTMIGIAYRIHRRFGWHAEIDVPLDRITDALPREAIEQQRRRYHPNRTYFAVDVPREQWHALDRATLDRRRDRAADQVHQDWEDFQTELRRIHTQAQKIDIRTSDRKA